MCKVAMVPIVLLALLGGMLNGGVVYAVQRTPGLQQVCTSHADCPDGTVCREGQCAALSCTTHADCPSATVCQEGLCAAVACTIHYDCPQYTFCYKGHCLWDVKQDVYHCGKPGCPPGASCLAADGSRDRCAEDPAYVCATACDCGPAHCCKDNRCVKDVDDPWLPGGEPVPGLSCTTGVDATYCCAAPDCFAGSSAAQATANLFRCYDSGKGAVEKYCGGGQCFATAADCALGQTCVDVTPVRPEEIVPGKSCWLQDGGACVSNALAEALFGFEPQELIAPCTQLCTSDRLGQSCDAGWRSGLDGRYAYERVIAQCGSCANGTCDEGEYPGTCPADCRCGDGSCAPVEVRSCPADCGRCGDGACSPWESVRSCALDCRPAAHDNWCELDETWGCPGDCPCPDAPYYPGVYAVCGDRYCQDAAVGGPESCANCGRDCGPCAPATSANLAAGSAAQLFARLVGGSEGARRDAFAPDIARGVVVKDGVVYVAGQTYSLDFPTGDETEHWGSGWNGFVLKLDTQGSILVAQYLAGADAGSSTASASGHAARDIAVAADGTAYCVGSDGVVKLPPGGGATAIYTFGGEDGGRLGGGYGIAVDTDGAVYAAGADGAIKLNGAGELLYRNTSLGGTAYDLAVAADGSAYVVGEMGLAKLGADGTTLFTVDLHGTGYGVALAGYAVYVAGQTYDPGFAATPGAWDTTGDAAGEAFLAQIDLSGNIVYATLLGGSGYDSGRAIAVDGAGQVFVTGVTRSGDFPLAAGETGVAAGDAGDLFLAQFTPRSGGGLELVKAALFGGFEPVAPPYFTPDRGFGVAVDSACHVYVTGEAGTTDLAHDAASGSDGFSAALVMKLAAADVTAPVVDAGVAKAQLWPVNHMLVDIGLRFAAADACDGRPALAILVTSDEDPVDALGSGGSGSAPDAVITDDGHVLLRAERSGLGDGRVYVITVTATDAAGNVGTARVAVSVNRDVARTAVDSGQSYVVASRGLDGVTPAAGRAAGNAGWLYLPEVAREGE